MENNANQAYFHELQLKRRADSFLSSAVLRFILALTASIFLSLDRNDACSNVPAKLWIGVAIGCYLAEMITGLYQWHYLKSNRRSSLALMVLRYIVLTTLTGWLVYGNTIYYSAGMEACKNGLKLTMFMLILLGYLTMAECCLSGCLIVILVPVYIIMLRRHRRPNWIPAPPAFIKDLVRTKFNTVANPAQEMCPICMLDFQESDEIVPLPCDEKHYFH